MTIPVSVWRNSWKRIELKKTIRNDYEIPVQDVRNALFNILKMTLVLPILLDNEPYVCGQRAEETDESCGHVVEMTWIVKWQLIAWFNVTFWGYRAEEENTIIWRNRASSVGEEGEGHANMKKRNDEES